MSETTRVTEKGQATIPKRLREKYDLEPGDEVVWVETDEGIVVKKHTMAEARGMLISEETPERANELFARAEAGETVIHAPSTAVAETLYAVSRDMDVRGTRFTVGPDEVYRALFTNGPLSLVAPDEDELAALSTVVDAFSIYDAIVVASHRARETDAIVTNDAVIGETDFPTIWE